MSIRRLEVRAARLGLWPDVPAAAPLVGDQRQAQRARNPRDELAVGRDGAQPVADAEVAALERLQRVLDRRRGGGEEDVGFSDGGRCDLLRRGHFFPVLIVVWR